MDNPTVRDHFAQVYGKITLLESMWCWRCWSNTPVSVKGRVAGCGKQSNESLGSIKCVYLLNSQYDKAIKDTIP
jgi:hypothetical protein